jgi:hypothetical protein
MLKGFPWEKLPPAGGWMKVKRRDYPHFFGHSLIRHAFPHPSRLRRATFTSVGKAFFFPLNRRRRRGDREVHIVRPSGWTTPWPPQPQAVYLAKGLPRRCMFGENAIVTASVFFITEAPSTCAPAVE